MINRNFYKRLERLETRAQDAIPPRFVVVNGGEPGGATSVRGPDGRPVWWNPPEGFKAGEPLDAISPCEVFIVVLQTRGGPDVTATTARGPDGRLVWLNPPEGCKAGEPIECTAMDRSSGEIVRLRAPIA